MPYVMVPVPAEHEEEFGQWLLTRTLQAKLSAWPDGAVAELIDQADEPSRAILLHLARAGDLWADATRIATVGGLSLAELLDRIKAFNELSISRTWPALVMVKTEASPRAGADPVHTLLMAGGVRTEVIRILGG